MSRLFIKKIGVRGREGYVQSVAQTEEARESIATSYTREKQLMVLQALHVCRDLVPQGFRAWWQ